MPDTIAHKLRGWLVAVVILCIALGSIFFQSSNWRADVTLLSTS
jgi:hypothetical protein